MLLSESFVYHHMPKPAVINSRKYNTCDFSVERDMIRLLIYSDDSRCFACKYTIRKLAHAIYRDFLSFKNLKFSAENFDIFLNFTQNIDCGYTLEPPRRGGSNEYPQSMFRSKNKKNRYTPAYPTFLK